MIHTPYYPPEMGAPPARIYESARILSEMGHEITIVTAFPNRPHGKIYPGFRNIWCNESFEDGIRVIRTWIRPSSASASFISRTINDLSFSCSSVLANLTRLGPQDIMIVQNPPIFSTISGFLLKLLTRAKMVMWCGDVWPDVLVESGELQEGVVSKIMRLLQRFGFSQSHALALTNPEISERIRQTYRCPPTIVWSNAVDTEWFHPKNRNEELRRQFGCSEDDVLVGYVGLHGRFQGLECIIQAVIRMKDVEGFKFVLVGDGVEKRNLMQLVEAAQCEHIVFKDSLPRTEMPQLVASCDVAVVSLSTRMPGTMPSKFYEACASGAIPLVADGCEAAKLVVATKCGEVYEPGNIDSAEATLRRMINYLPNEKREKSDLARLLSLRFDRKCLAEYMNKCIGAICADEAIPSREW